MSLYVAVFILVVAVGVNSRPAIAPPGDYELGFYAVGHNIDFLTGLAASTVIFISSSGHSANVSIIAEMRNPKEYKKPIAATMSLLNASYLVFSLVIYRYCGKWIASPSLGSAGDIIKKVTYGIGLPGIAFSTTINQVRSFQAMRRAEIDRLTAPPQHLACKYLFVRVLRDSEHLQRKTFRHWATWFSITIGVGVVAFIIGEPLASLPRTGSCSDTAPTMQRNPFPSSLFSSPSSPPSPSRRSPSLSRQFCGFGTSAASTAAGRSTRSSLPLCMSSSSS